MIAFGIQNCNTHFPPYEWNINNMYFLLLIASANKTEQHVLF